MTYEEFYSSVSKYYKLYDSGLKKEANKYLKVFCNSLEESKSYKVIMEQFAFELFENDVFDFRKERHSRLPYFLNELLIAYLREEAYLNRMPHMRYFSELAKYDEESAKEGYDFLSKAYEHPDCDEQTIYLMFERHLNLIDFAVHHFPDGYVVDKEVVDQTFEACKDMINKHEINEEKIKSYEYYDRLCQAFDLFEEDQRQEDFDFYLRQVGLSYTPIKTYYYK